MREVPLKAWLTEGRGSLEPDFAGFLGELDESLKQALMKDLKFFECKNSRSLVVALKKE